MGTATGAKLYFNMITANGKKLDDYSPVQGDVIKNTPLMGNIITEENTD